VSAETLAGLTLATCIATLLGTGGVLYSLGALRVEVDSLRSRVAGLDTRLGKLERKEA